MLRTAMEDNVKSPLNKMRKCVILASKKLTLMKNWRLQNNSGIEASTDVPIPAQYHISCKLQFSGPHYSLYSWIFVTSCGCDTSPKSMHTSLHAHTSRLNPPLSCLSPLFLSIIHTHKHTVDDGPTHLAEGCNNTLLLGAVVVRVSVAKMRHIIDREARKNGDENSLDGAQAPAHHHEESENCLREDQQQEVSSTEPQTRIQTATSLSSFLGSIKLSQGIHLYFQSKTMLWCILSGYY